MKRAFILLLAMSAVSYGQLANSFFAQSGPVTVAAGATYVVTLQAPAGVIPKISPFSIIGQCLGQTFSIDQAVNGTAATVTAVTPTALPPATTHAFALFYKGSDVGAGTPVATTLNYTTGSIAVIGGVLSLNSQTNSNYSVSLKNTGTASCTASISVYWIEQ